MPRRQSIAPCAAPAPRAGRRHDRRRHWGLGLVELLICLSISSVLLTSVGVAFLGSVNCQRDAQERGQLLNAGRSCMYRIMSDVRMCDAAGPYDPTSSVNSTETGQFANVQVPGAPTPGPQGAGGSGVLGIQLLKTHADSTDPTASIANPVLITYWFDAPNSQILMTRKVGAATPTPVLLCQFVQSFQLFLQPVTIPANTQTGQSAAVVLLSATASLNLANKNAGGTRIISDGSQTLTLNFSDSAMPRRNFGGG